MNEIPGSVDDDRRQRRRARRDFFVFLAVWVIVSAFLVAMWAMSDPLYFWPIWPILGIGLAVAFLGVDAYGPPERRKAESLIDLEVQRLLEQRR